MLIVFILLTCLSFSNVLSSTQTEPNNTYILDLFQTKNITCNPHELIVKTDDSDNDYKLFLNDLNNVCSQSQTDKASRLLCRIVFIELQLACHLPNSSLPTPVKYSLAYSAEKICAIHKINLTNIWIWEKLSSAEREEFLPTSDALCSTITAKEEILFLAKFFYKIAPRIRRADTIHSDKLQSDDSLTNQVQNEDIHVGWMEDQSLLDKIPNNLTAYGHVLPLSRANRTRALRRKNLRTNTTANATTTTSPADEPMESDEPGNKTIRSEGLPLGRVGEKPEREQVNERPKPKVLDVESVFKLNENQQKNWVEGSKLSSDDERFNARRFHLDNDPLVSSRRKFPFRLKSNRQTEHRRDDDGWIDDYYSSMLIFVLCIIVVYLILSNKNKILGLIIEGCKRRRGGNNQRPTHRHARLSQSTK